MKRLFDLLLSICLLVILFPLFIIISFIIKISSRGPIFFIQERVGKDAKLFKMIKFRTMYLNQKNTSNITIKGDLRVTKIGVFLRKYKLDELPELINVVVGHMSMVGPRPDVSGYADKLVGEDSKIVKLRPGITGPASLKYANEEEILSSKDNPKLYNDNILYPDKVKINLDYYYNNNIWLDIKIIFLTIFRSNY